MKASLLAGRLTPATMRLCTPIARLLFSLLLLQRDRNPDARHNDSRFYSPSTFWKIFPSRGLRTDCLACHSPLLQCGDCWFVPDGVFWRVFVFDQLFLTCAKNHHVPSKLLSRLAPIDMQCRTCAYSTNRGSRTGQTRVSAQFIMKDRSRSQFEVT